MQLRRCPLCGLVVASFAAHEADCNGRAIPLERGLLETAYIKKRSGRTSGSATGKLATRKQLDTIHKSSADLVACNLCSAKVRIDRLKKHRLKVHGVLVLQSLAKPSQASGVRGGNLSESQQSKTNANAKAISAVSEMAPSMNLLAPGQSAIVKPPAVQDPPVPRSSSRLCKVNQTPVPKSKLTSSEKSASLIGAAGTSKRNKIRSQGFQKPVPNRSGDDCEDYFQSDNVEDERRLDGSRGFHIFREDGHFGSYSSFDDMGDESEP